MNRSTFIPTVLIVLLSICLALLSACSRKLSISRPVEVPTDWPMFRGDQRHTGFLPLTTSPPYVLLWTYETKGALVASPTVTRGLLLAPSWDKKIYILNPLTGKRIKRLSLKSSISSTPTGAEGWIFGGSEHPRSSIFCLDLTTGQNIWQREALDIVSSPAAADGRVFLGSIDGQVYALTADSGQVLWTFKTGAPVRSSPAIAGDLLYIGSQDKRIYALRTSTGALAWEQTTGGEVESSPAVGHGSVFVGSSDGTLYAFQALTGDIQWTFPTDGAIHASPAVDDSACYIGSYDGNLYALTASTGQLLWQWKTGSILRSSPAVSSNAVFQGAHDGHLYVLDKTDGTLLWKYKTGGSISSSPALTSAGVFVGCDDGYLYAFGFREAAGRQKMAE